MKQKTQNPFEKYQLGEEEAYDPSVDKVFPFKLVGDPIDGIEVRYSNMAGGFPFEFEGRTWKNSEELYLLGEFSTGTDRDLEIQNDILSATLQNDSRKRSIKLKSAKTSQSFASSGCCL